MSIVMGNKRISEDVYSIVTSDGVTMESTIEGISTLEDLKNKIIWLVSPVAGGGVSTLNVNNLGGINIVSDLTPTNVSAGWCSANVPFPLSLYISSDGEEKFFILCK